MILVVESPMRYASCVTSGVKPTCINIGINIGAISAHLAVSTGMTKSMAAATITKSSSNGKPVNPISVRRRAPFTEITIPKLEYANIEVNWAAQKIKTKKLAIPFIPSVIIFDTS